MVPHALAPHWDIRDTTCLLVMIGVLLVMTGVAGLLHVRARSDKQRALANDFGARTRGWWLVVLYFSVSVLTGGWVVVVAFGLCAAVAWREFAGVAAGAWWRALGFIYCVIFLSAAPAIALRFGTNWLIFVIVVVQAGDVLQYLFGKTLGRRPMAPWLSPKKTWEGLIGGVCATALLGAVLAPVVQVGATRGLICGLGLSLAGSGGGLAMSAVKRRHGVKDFGRWLPGHGGLLDRIDSLCAASAVAYVMLVVSS